MLEISGEMRGEVIGGNGERGRLRILGIGVVVFVENEKWGLEKGKIGGRGLVMSSNV